MQIFIHTQYCENYGDESRPYWKMKGGSTVVVTGAVLPMDHTIGHVASAIVESLRDKIEYRNPMSEEYIIDWHFAADDEMPEEERMQLEYDGRITYPSTRIDLATPIAA